MNLPEKLINSYYVSTSCVCGTETPWNSESPSSLTLSLICECSILITSCSSLIQVLAHVVHMCVCFVVMELIEHSHELVWICFCMITIIYVHM